MKYLLIVGAILLSAMSSGAQDGPRLVQVNEAFYPLSARVARVEGSVHVSVVVDKDGRVLSAKVLDGPAMLREASETIAKKAEYLCEGCRIEKNQFKVAVNFVLLDASAKCGETFDVPAGYSFDLSDPKHNADVKFMKDEVRVTSVSFLMCDSASVNKKRAYKCGYLWRCEK